MKDLKKFPHDPSLSTKIAFLKNFSLELVLFHRKLDFIFYCFLKTEFFPRGSKKNKVKVSSQKWGIRETDAPRLCFKTQSRLISHCLDFIDSVQWKFCKYKQYIIIQENIGESPPRYGSIPMKISRFPAITRSYPTPHCWLSSNISQRPHHPPDPTLTSNLYSGFVFRFLAIISFASFIYLAFTDEKYKPKVTPFFVGYFIFALFMGLSTIFSMDASRSFWSNYERMEGYINVLALFVLALSAISLRLKELEWSKVFRCGAFSIWIRTNTCSTSTISVQFAPWTNWIQWITS